MSENRLQLYRVNSLRMEFGKTRNEKPYTAATTEQGMGSHVRQQLIKFETGNHVRQQLIKFEIGTAMYGNT